MAAKPIAPLIVIAGPTASGKSSLAMELAEKYEGEIICADSRTIYIGMDIGTAKPSKEDQLAVPHWGLDLVRPGEYFSAADFKAYADIKITEIRDRGHVPFLVGGTGLYIDSVIFNYQFGAPVNKKRRTQLNESSLEELNEYCKTNNIKLPENEKNKRYIIRAIENANSITKRQSTPLENTVIVGITTDKVLLRSRIEERAEHLFEDGVVQEATLLGKRYGWESEAMTSNIYKLMHQYNDGILSYDELQTRFLTSDWQLAKRQLTWLKRNQFIQWFSLFDAKNYLVRMLANRLES